MAATGTPTPNIGLRIPLGTDPASVDDINYNSNLLDTKLGAVGSDSVQDQIDTLNGNIATLTTNLENAKIKKYQISRTSNSVGAFSTGLALSNTPLVGFFGDKQLIFYFGNNQYGAIAGDWDIVNGNYVFVPYVNQSKTAIIYYIEY